MKKLISLIMCVTLLCGCNAQNTESQPEVEIRYPTDNTVNGYRTEAHEPESNASGTSSFPDRIPVENVRPETESDKISSTKVSYIGNSNSHVFHTPTCASVATMSEDNKVKLKSRSSAVSDGYKPCTRCKP